MLFEKMQKNYRIKKTTAMAIAFIVMLSMLTMGAIIDNDTKKVTLVQKDSFNDTINTREVITRKHTIEDFLEEQNVVLADDDVVNAGSEDIVLSGATITVAKSRLVEIHADGGIKFERATEKTVLDSLQALGYGVKDTDTLLPAGDSLIEENMVIQLTRVDIIEETVEVLIPYQSIRRIDPTKKVDEKRIDRQGIPGKKQETVKITRVNGVETSREVLSTVVLSEPQDEIVIWGTIEKEAVAAKKKSVSKGNSSFHAAGSAITQATANANANTNTSDKGFSYSKVFTMTATAYDPSPATNAGYTKTAYGLTPQYGVVAVDPKVIPLGTKLYIESSDGGASWVYGYCIAGDTGGAIKGNKVDLCFNTKAECKKFGRKTATVYILD